MKLLILVLLAVIHFVVCIEQTTVKPKASGSCGIDTAGPLVQQISRPISYAGGLFWADDGEKLAYVDRFGTAIGRYTPSDGKFNRFPGTGGKINTAIFPVKNATGLKFVVGVDRGLILVDITGSGTNLEQTSKDLITITNHTRETLIKGKVDSKGRLWFTSEYKGSLGKLYKIDNLQKPEVISNDFYCGAGMAWTIDDKYFYVVDSKIEKIFKYDFNSKEGSIDNKRVIFDKKDHENLGGSPFDIVLDDEGYLWIGLFHGGSVIKYDEKTKEILQLVAIPASDIVSLEFGGLDKKTLYVGTAKHYLHKPELQPAAGAIFAISGLSVTGIKDNDIIIPKEYE